MVEEGESGRRWWRQRGSGGTRVRYLRRYLRVSKKRSRMLGTGNDISIYLYFMNVLTYPILIKDAFFIFFLLSNYDINILYSRNSRLALRSFMSRTISKSRFASPDAPGEEVPHTQGSWGRADGDVTGMGFGFVGGGSLVSSHEGVSDEGVSRLGKTLGAGEGALGEEEEGGGGDVGLFAGMPTVELVERLLKENRHIHAQLRSARRVASSSRQAAAEERRQAHILKSKYKSRGRSACME